MPNAIDFFVRRIAAAERFEEAAQSWRRPFATLQLLRCEELGAPDTRHSFEV